MDEWIAWRSPVAPHVLGEYEPRRYDEEGTPEPQRVRFRCEVCQQSGAVECKTGQVRTHIQRFAASHLHHLDPFRSRA
jgi:hypothetical protein